MGRSISPASSVEVPLFTSAASLAPTTSSVCPSTRRTSRVRCAARYGSSVARASVGATGTTNCASGCTARIRSAASSMGGRSRFSSAGRLPGTIAMVVRPAGRPSSARYCSGGPGGGRSANGWPTNRAETPVPS